MSNPTTKEELLNKIKNGNNQMTLEEFKAKKQEFLTGEKTFNEEDYIAVIKQQDVEIETLKTTIQNLEYSLVTRNSELKTQKQISFVLGIILSIIVFGSIIKIFLSKYKEKIRKDLMKELNPQQEAEIK